MTGAAIDYTTDEDGALMFTPSAHRYTVERATYGRQGIRLAAADGAVLHLDTFDVLSDLGRARFVREAKKKAGTGGDLVQRELMMIAANLATILPDKPRASESMQEEIPYQIIERGIWYERYVPNAGLIETRISNFGAEIVTDITIDDGSGDPIRKYEIDCWQGESRRRKTVDAKAFAGLDWVTDALGSGAVVFPGSRHTEHAVAAIQLRSTPERRRVYGHTGWKQLDDGVMGYLTTSGAITGHGLRDDVSVILDRPLDRYDLPEPPTGNDLVRAWRSLLGLLDIAPRSVMMPLLCALIRSVFGPADFALYLKGATGTGKSQLAGMIQSAFGAGLGPEHLPANFASTGNALELIANLAKDAVLVIDDFQRNRAANVDAVAERIGRALGNQSGRARLTRDAHLRSQRPPRGTVIITGEDIPKGESLRARMSILELPRDGLDFPNFRPFQEASREGVYATALAGFLQWIATEHDDRMAALAARFEDHRTAFYTEHAAHPRTTTTAAHLLSAFTLLLDFLGETGGWDQAERDVLAESAEAELRRMIDAQGHHLAAANPVQQFIQSLDAVLTSGEAHLANPHGEEPIDPGAWGWRKITTSNGDEWRPQGKQIGWVQRDRPGISLEWTAAFSLIQKQAIAIGSELPLTETTLLKRLDERGLLLSRDEARGTFKVRRHLGGRYRNIVHLAFPPDDDGEEGLA